MNKLSSRIIVAASFAIVCATAHGQSFSGSSVPTTQARAVLSVKTGVVVDVQDASIEVGAPPENAAIGGLLGGALAAALTRGEAWQWQTTAAAAGAFVGKTVAQQASQTERRAAQIVVKLTDGQPIAVVQEMGDDYFAAGDPVYVVGNYPVIRVVRAPKP